MHFQLISAHGVKYDDEAYEVLVPTKDGEIAVFKEHMPLLAVGVPGVLSIRRTPSDNDDQLEHFAVYGGVLQTEGDSARFITEEVTTADEVSEQESREALERAQKLVDSAGTRGTLHEARSVAQHHEVRLNLARLKRRHHR
jgi:ATP synthase F1 epsilon subunit